MLREFIVLLRAVTVSAAAAILGAAMLAACGVKGPLKLPPPQPAATAAGVTAPETKSDGAAEAPAAPAPKPAETRP